MLENSNTSEINYPFDFIRHIRLWRSDNMFLCVISPWSSLRNDRLIRRLVSVFESFLSSWLPFHLNVIHQNMWILNYMPVIDLCLHDWLTSDTMLKNVSVFLNLRSSFDVTFTRTEWNEIALFCSRFLAERRREGNEAKILQHTCLISWLPFIQSQFKCVIEVYEVWFDRHCSGISPWCQMKCIMLFQRRSLLECKNILFVSATLPSRSQFKCLQELCSLMRFYNKVSNACCICVVKADLVLHSKRQIIRKDKC